MLDDGETAGAGADASKVTARAATWTGGGTTVAAAAGWLTGGTAVATAAAAADVARDLAKISLAALAAVVMEAVLH